MPDRSGRDALAGECRVLCRYLVGTAPDRATIDAYCRAHDGARVTATGSFDRALVRLAHARPPLARLVDAYTSAFSRTALVRRKLVLLLAILESHSPVAEAVDSIVTRSRGRFLLSAGLRTVAFVVTAAVTAVPLTPLRVSCSVADRLTHRRRRHASPADRRGTP